MAPSACHKASKHLLTKLAAGMPGPLLPPTWEGSGHERRRPPLTLRSPHPVHTEDGQAEAPREKVTAMRHRTHESCKGPTASTTRARGPAAGSLETPPLLPLPGAHPCGCQAASVRAPAAEPGPEAPGRGSPGLSRRPLLPGQRAGARSSPSRGTPGPPGGWFLLQPPGTNNRCTGVAHRGGPRAGPRLAPVGAKQEATVWGAGPPQAP